MRRTLTVLALALLLIFPLWAEDLPLIGEGLAWRYSTDDPDGLTSNGEVFDQTVLSGAHSSLPFGSVVRVVTEDGASADIRINDRTADPSLAIALTSSAASALGITIPENVTLYEVFIPTVIQTKYKLSSPWLEAEIDISGSGRTLASISSALIAAGYKPMATDENTIRVRFIPAYSREETEAAFKKEGLTNYTFSEAPNPFKN